MDFLTNLGQGFAIALNPWNLVYAFIGAVIGTAVGVLPGLGPSATIALLLPVTYKLDPTSATIMLAGIYYGAMYGGSTTSILLNIPGESSSVLTCLDGYQMARKGRAGPALGMSAMGSFVAGTLGVVAMSMVAPALAKFALKFGPAEYTSLVFFGLMMTISLSTQSLLKGLLMSALGIIVATVGIDPVFGAPRFTFGIPRLMDGVDFIAAAMGLFGISEVMANLESPEVREVFKTSLRGLLPDREDWRRSWKGVLRGSAIGFFIGVLPGGGPTISAFIAYAVEKKASKHPEEFGTGAIEGVASPEAANNAASTSSFIPLLTLGIPGNNAMAMMFVALMLHGVTPGPMLFQDHPNLFWGVIASMYVGNVMLLALNLPLIGMWVRFLKVPYHYMAAIIVIICVIGAYSIKNTAFDVGLMMLFGVFGYFLKKGGFPLPPMMLSIVLGKILERSFLQSLQLSAADLGIFIQKPISAALLATTFIVMVVFPSIRWFRKRFESFGDDEA